jgi:hypothetical protein
MTTLMETLKTVAPLQMAAYSVLALAIAWVLWELLCLHRAVRAGTAIFPATIPTLFIFSGAIVGVELLHRSPPSPDLAFCPQLATWTHRHHFSLRSAGVVGIFRAFMLPFFLDSVPNHT